jgi:hypothetical protein
MVASARSTTAGLGPSRSERSADPVHPGNRAGRVSAPDPCLEPDNRGGMPEHIFSRPRSSPTGSSCRANRASRYRRSRYGRSMGKAAYARYAAAARRLALRLRPGRRPMPPIRWGRARAAGGAASRACLEYHKHETARLWVPFGRRWRRRAPQECNSISADRLRVVWNMACRAELPPLESLSMHRLSFIITPASCPIVFYRMSWRPSDDPAVEFARGWPVTNRRAWSAVSDDCCSLEGDSRSFSCWRLIEATASSCPAIRHGLWFMTRQGSHDASDMTVLYNSLG